MRPSYQSCCNRMAKFDNVKNSLLTLSVHCAANHPVPKAKWRCRWESASTKNLHPSCGMIAKGRRSCTMTNCFVLLLNPLMATLLFLSLMALAQKPLLSLPLLSCDHRQGNNNCSCCDSNCVSGLVCHNSSLCHRDLGLCHGLVDSDD